MNKADSLRLFFFSTLQTPFISADQQLLRNAFSVDVLIDRGIRVLPKVFVRVMRSDTSLVWFASVYSAFIVFFSRLFNHPSVVLAGGVDVAKEEDIGYGLWLTPWKARLAKYVFRNVDRLVVVDPSLAEAAKRLANYDGENIVCIPTGYDANVWRPSSTKELFVLTVASCDTAARLKAKGVDMLLEVARAMPETRFVLIGTKYDVIAAALGRVPDNLVILPRLEHEHLLAHYQRAKIYFQPSRFEGLPNALCEALLCGCIPVGTKAGGIPTAIGRTGILVESGDVRAMVDALRTVLAWPSEVGLQARQRIIDNFPLVRRNQELQNLIRELVR